MIDLVVGLIGFSTEEYVPIRRVVKILLSRRAVTASACSCPRCSFQLWLEQYQFSLAGVVL